MGAAPKAVKKRKKKSLKEAVEEALKKTKKEQKQDMEGKETRNKRAVVSRQLARKVKAIVLTHQINR